MTLRDRRIQGRGFLPTVTPFVNSRRSVALGAPKSPNAITECVKQWGRNSRCATAQWTNSTETQNLARCAERCIGRLRSEVLLLPVSSWIVLSVQIRRTTSCGALKGQQQFAGLLIISGARRSDGIKMAVSSRCDVVCVMYSNFPHASLADRHFVLPFQAHHCRSCKSNTVATDS